MRVLVTGSSGICGNHIIKELLKLDEVQEVVGISTKASHLYEDHPRRGLSRYIECYGNLLYPCYRLISQLNPNVIMHFAGISTANSPAEAVWNANVNTTLNLLEACKNLSVRFVHASSIVVNLYPLTVYGASKIAAEALVSSYKSMNENLRTISVRFCAVAGAGNSHGVVADLVRKHLSGSDNITVYGRSPGSIKPFVYAPELAMELVKLLRRDYWDFPYIQYCSPDNISVKRIAEIIRGEIGVDKVLDWDESKVWAGDHSSVSEVNSYCGMLPCKEVIKRATLDILREDYMWEKKCTV